jgi:hypothetical protein
MLEQIGRVRRRALPEQQPAATRRSSADCQLRLRFRAPPRPAAHAKTPARSPRRSAPPPWLGPSRSSRAISEACRLAGPPGRRRNRRGVRRASPSPSASSTALVISSTNSGMPSVRSTMSCRMFRQRLVADDAVDHGVDFALRQPIEGQRGHMRPPDPRRLEFRPERHDQQHAKARDPVHEPAERFQARGVGPMRVLEDHQHRTLACQRFDLAIERFQRFCRRCCGAEFERGIASVVRQRQHLGEERGVLARSTVARAARRACRASLRRVVARQPGGALHLADDRIKRAVGVLRRAEIAQRVCGSPRAAPAAPPSAATCRCRPRRRAARPGPSPPSPWTSAAAANRILPRARPSASGRSRAAPRSGFPPNSPQRRPGARRPGDALEVWRRDREARTDCRAACACPRR